MPSSCAAPPTRLAHVRELEALLSKYDPKPRQPRELAAGKHPVAVPPAVMAVLRARRNVSMP